MAHFNARLRFIDQFLARFQPVFSNTQMSALRSLVYGMFFDYKRLSLSAYCILIHIYNCPHFPIICETVSKLKRKWGRCLLNIS